MPIFEIRGTNTATGAPFFLQVVADDVDDARMIAASLPVALNSVREATNQRHGTATAAATRQGPVLRTNSKLLTEPIKTIGLGVLAGLAMWAAAMLAIAGLVALVQDSGGF